MLTLIPRILSALAPYAKAITAAGTTLVAVGAALADGGVTATEVAAILAAAGAIGGATYKVPNAPK